MSVNYLDGISLDGFSRPISMGVLRETRCSEIPRHAGIYVVERTSGNVPKFLAKSTGGWFKGKDPNYLPDEVQRNWVRGAHVVYVGKAAGRKGLYRRLCALIDFGSGKPVGHRGGRLLWHLPESEKLLVRWRTCPTDEADIAETDAIANFKSAHGGKRPFANMIK